VSPPGVTTFVIVAEVESLVLLVVHGLEAVTTFVFSDFGVVTVVEIAVLLTVHTLKSVTTSDNSKFIG
jgi:hypothetical protein